MKLWTRLTTSERGASMVEYALLVVLIAIVAIVALNVMGGSIANMFERTGSELDQTPGTTSG